MKRLDFRRYAIGLWAAAMLAGCGGSQPPIGAPGSMPENAGIMHRTVPASSYEVLHNFRGNNGDGEHPHAGLINVNGTLYGTTFSGGTYHHGAVYSVTTTGTESVLHSFRHGSDGEFPQAGLINVKGTLYGTTEYGGPRGWGTVYSITTTGMERVLYSFGGGSDGGNPSAGLINVEGTLFGTTYYGGGSGCFEHLGCGTVFSITTTGKEQVLHRFGDGSDGAGPLAGLINVNGALYGTTENGGSGCGSVGCGTVFSVTTTGKEQVLHSFGRGSDGIAPLAGLLNVNGTLYGTTISGSGSGCSGGGCGTVFSVTTTGAEKVLYRFGGGSDGAFPQASLIKLNGTLYGTTGSGGNFSGCVGGGGCGTLFSVTMTGTEQVLHSFGGSADGANPFAGLINAKGHLYGTTAYGGSTCITHSHRGCGTVFAFTP